MVGKRHAASKSADGFRDTGCTPVPDWAVALRGGTHNLTHEPAHIARILANPPRTSLRMSRVLCAWRDESASRTSSATGSWSDNSGHRKFRRRAPSRRTDGTVLANHLVSSWVADSMAQQHHTRAAVLFCRWCGAAISHDGRCATCAEREQANAEWFTQRIGRRPPRPVKRSLDLAPGASAAPPTQRGKAPIPAPGPAKAPPTQGGKAPTTDSRYQVKLAAMAATRRSAAVMRNTPSMRARTSPGMAPMPRHSAHWRPPTAWREAIGGAPVEAMFAVAVGLLCGLVVPILVIAVFSRP